MTETANEVRRVVSVLSFLIDPRLDEPALARTIEAMDEETAKDVLTAACAWIGGAIEVNAENKGIPVERLMAIVRKGLDNSITEVDRLDHEGGLFT